MIHLVSMKLRYVKGKSLRVYTMYCFARLQNCKTIKKAGSLFKNMCIAFGSPCSTTDVEEAVDCLHKEIKKDISSLPKCEENTLFETEQINEFDTYSELQENLTIKSRSAFHQYFTKIRDSTTDITKVDEKTDYPPNKFYCPVGLQAIYDKMFLFPFWSGLLLKENESRDTNSQAELWMRIVKKEILKGKRKLSPSEFVQRLHVSIRGRLIREEVSRPKTLKHRSKDQENLAKEGWKKVTSSKRTYYQSPTDLVLAQLRHGKSVSRTSEPDVSSIHKKICLKNILQRDKTIEISDNNEEMLPDIKQQNKVDTKTTTHDYNSNKTALTKQMDSLPLYRDKDLAKMSNICPTPERDEHGIVNENDGSSFTPNSPPWGGVYFPKENEPKLKIQMVNTCPIDNMLYMLYIITSLRPDLRTEKTNYNKQSVSTDKILWCLNLFCIGEWDQGKGYWLENVCQLKKNRK